MAQTFVPRNDLMVEDANNPVKVVAAYPNAMVVAIDLHGPNCTVMLIADSLLFVDKTKGELTVLRSNWRDDYVPVLNGEAARRINIVFPEYKQRNYTAQYQDYITQYGADTTTWPQNAKDFKIEYDRGWQYVKDIRTTSNAWTSMPQDPTADSIWPTPVNPVQ